MACDCGYLAPQSTLGNKSYSWTALWIVSPMASTLRCARVTPRSWNPELVPSFVAPQSTLSRDRRGRELRASSQMRARVLWLSRSTPNQRCHIAMSRSGSVALDSAPDLISLAELFLRLAGGHCIRLGPTRTNARAIMHPAPCTLPCRHSCPTS